MGTQGVISVAKIVTTQIFEKALHKRLKKFAKRHGLTMCSIVNVAVARELDSREANERS